MKQFVAALKQLANNPEVRKRLLFTAAIFFVFRFLAHVPVPGVDVTQIRSFFNANQFLSVLNIFSGGTLANFSVMAVGINPYITASIVFQLAGLIIPSLKELQKDGEAGKERVNQYTRFLSVPIAVLQSISVLTLLRSQGLLTERDPLTFVAMIFTLVAGSMILMWLGELVTTYGIGNGISMVLFAGIVGQLPIAIAQIFSVTTSQDMLKVGILGGVFLLVMMLMVFMNEAIRKVQIQYARRTRGDRTTGGQMTHFPIKINVAGVLPVIFAVSLMLAPSFLGRFLTGLPNPALSQFGQNLNIWFAPTSWVYMVTYFIIVFAFTYISALIFFNTEEISEDLKKSGAFVPGIRPGGPTKKFLNFVVTRITFVGACFLGFIAVLPSLAQVFTGVQSLAIGGTSMLIVVSVVLETAKQIEGMLIGQNYDKFI